MRSSRFVMSAARLASLLLVTLSTASAETEAAPPHVVVILTDDMGYGDARCYNPDSKIPTPHIDRLAREGMRFTDAHASGPLCHQSRYGLLTGRYPFRTDVSRWPKHPLIESGQTTIASLLKSQGYHTAMVGKWHLGFEERGYQKPLPGGPVDRGFDQFFGLRASTDIPPYFYIRNDQAVTPPTGRIEANQSKGWSPIQGKFWREGGIAPDLDLHDVLTTLTDEACATIEKHHQAVEPSPLLLYLAYTGPHTPWLPSRKFVEKSGAGLYGDFLMMVDEQVGRVIEALDEAGIVDDTLILFTSDNGPVWYQQDIDKFSHRSVGDLRGMKGDAWEGGHRMPFIVRWPSVVERGSTSGQTICFTDLLATLADLLDTPLPDGAGPDSFSFLPVLKGRQPDDQAIRPAIVMRPANRDSMMIRSGDWKLITQPGSGGFSKSPPITERTPQGQLYDLRKDPSETTNLYLKHPDIVARLQYEMQEIVDSGTSKSQ